MKVGFVLQGLVRFFFFFFFDISNRLPGFRYVKILRDIFLAPFPVLNYKKESIAMSVVTITLNDKDFQLYCNDGEEAALLDVAAILNQKITEIKAASPAASTELLLLMAALKNQAEVQFLTDSLAGVINKSDIGIEEKKLAETLAIIANYLADLARKLGK